MLKFPHLIFSKARGYYNQMKKIFSLLVCLFIFGCATTKEVYAPDGELALIVDCSGEYLNWGACDLKAGETCKERGYTVIKKDSDKNSTSSLTGGGGFVYGGSVEVVNRTMMFRCNNP